jgi:hypothetical protein
MNTLRKTKICFLIITNNIKPLMLHPFLEKERCGSKPFSIDRLNERQPFFYPLVNVINACIDDGVLRVFHKKIISNPMREETDWCD